MCHSTASGTSVTEVTCSVYLILASSSCSAPCFWLSLGRSGSHCSGLGWLCIWVRAVLTVSVWLFNLLLSPCSSSSGWQLELLSQSSMFLIIFHAAPAPTPQPQLHSRNSSQVTVVLWFNLCTETVWTSVTVFFLLWLLLGPCVLDTILLLLKTSSFCCLFLIFY